MKKLHIYLFVLTFISIGSVYSGVERYTSRLDGTGMAVDSLRDLYEDKHFEMASNPFWPSLFTNISVKNFIRLGINPEVVQANINNGEVNLELTTEAWNYSTSSFDVTTTSVKLFLNHDGTNGYLLANDLSTYVFNDAHRVKMKIVSIIGLNAADIFLESSIEVERYYNFEIPLVSNLSAISATGINNAEIEFRWSYHLGAESYELEWVHVNSYAELQNQFLAPSDLSFNFYLNSTRIETTDNYYRIPNVFADGYIVFRIRPIGRKAPLFTERLEGIWSGAEKGSVGSFSHFIPIAGFLPTINWSHQIAYAEDGKRFEGMSFSDGLGRGRQSVSRNSVTDQVIVSNVYFDEVGRPVVSDLPTPVDNESMHHFQNFNLPEVPVSGQPLSYMWQNLNYPEVTPCVPVTHGFSTSSGAGEYYSPNNPNNPDNTSSNPINPNHNGANAHIPDAENYPFTRVEYIDDLTGRVRSVSSAGATLTNGKGKETRYHYVTASQEELDELFGVEVGYASHYQKMITVDPNGQVYTQFFDMAGRVVASYLEGSEPTGVVPVEGNLSGLSTKTILAQGGAQTINTNILPSSELTHTEYIAVTDDYTFEYGMTPQQYQSACNQISTCFDCVYDLEFHIVGECGNVFGDTIQINGGILNDLCEGIPYALPTVTENLPKGEYIISKKLTVNQDAIDEYWCYYINDINCLEPISDIFDELYLAEEFADCEHKYDFSNNSSICDGYKNLMLSDMSPGGQYAQFTNSSGVYTSTDPYSIFNLSNSFGASYVWNASGMTYLDENGVDVTATVTTNTLYGTDYAAKLKYFILNFREEWAHELLQFHPEYCALQMCEANSASNAFSEQMLNIKDFSIAYQAGYFKPLGFLNPANLGSVFPLPQSTLLDPLFIYNGANYPIPNPTPQSVVNSMSSTMTSTLNNYITVPDAFVVSGSTTMSLWEYSIWLQVKDQFPSPSDFFIHKDEFDMDCYLDLIWLTFRDLYLEAKNQIFYNALLDYSASSCSLSNCIGVEPASAPAVCTGHDLSDYSPRWISPDIFNDYVTSLGTGSTIAANINTQNSSSCNTICEDYVDQWLIDLAGCVITGLSQSQQDDLRADLILLCAEGCVEDQNSMPNNMQNNMAGSTTTPPGSPVTISIGGTATSIQDILDAHGFSETPICTELLITAPGPYQSFDERMGEIVKPLDTCACETLTEQSVEYDAAVISGEASSLGVTCLEDWISVSLGIELNDAHILICKCEDNFDGTSYTADVNGVLFFPDDVDIPISLSCNDPDDCIDCLELDNALTDLETRFVVTSGPNALTLAQFEAHSSYPLIAQTYFNNTFGFDYEYQVYLDFRNSCTVANAPAQSPSYCHLNPMMDKWFDMMKVVVLRGKFKDGVSNYNLINNNIVYAFSPLQDEGIGKIYSTSISSNTLTTTFQDGAPTCNFTFDLPALATFGFEDIVRFVSIFPTSSDCGNVNSTFDLEVEYYDCGIIQTAYLNCTSSCFEVNTCVCPGSSPELCKDSDLFSLEEENCYEPRLSEIILQTFELYDQNVLDQYDIFMDEYNNKCAEAFDTEEISIYGMFNTYQKTLFYYDQSGSLVKTVAPKGVNELTATDLSDVITDRNSIVTSTLPVTPNTTIPVQTYETSYIYNSYNQLVSTENPDQDGSTDYWYDRFGRIVLSQNPVQKVDSQYAYSSYDSYGRPIEVGIVEYSASLPDLKHENCDDIVRQWVLSGVRTEVTITVYDKVDPLTDQTKFAAGIQQNLRLRVSSVFYYDALNNGTTGLANYESATHYSYDPHGNVIEQLQDIPKLAPVEQDIKSTQYEFELISGNVKNVHYQKDKADQITHSYDYDKLNRLTEVFTSTDQVHKTRQAHYRYFDYGPLARVELGKNKVQGMDYAYTINGWLKGMNSSFIDFSDDVGKDGTTGYYSNNPQSHSLFAKDVLSYTLGYFEGDYKPISSASQMEGYDYAGPNVITFNTASGNLYNGNIRNYVNSIFGLETLGVAYSYDQLNRLKEAQYYDHDPTDPEDGFTNTTSDYTNTYSYDKNGNLLNLSRKGTGLNLDMDDFVYRYVGLDNLPVQDPSNPLSGSSTYSASSSNRLSYVEDDPLNSSNYSDDIDNMTTTFEYDKLGQLTKDESENILNIEWRRGDKKIKKMTRGTAGNESELEFVYNTFGQRVVKIEKPTSSGIPQAEDQWVYTYYTYDANGQVMAVYDVDMSATNNQARLEEQHLYGASRLGMVKKDLLLFDNGPIVFSPPNKVENYVGRTYYEINNYLGNVNAVITDRRAPPTSPGPGLSTWEAIVVSNADYYPFGMLMPGRSNVDQISGSTTFPLPVPYDLDYRYAYNGMEQDNEVTGNIGTSYTTEFRQYDPRLARWKSLDPLMHQFPSLSPYCAFDNNPIRFTDPLGLESVDPIDRTGNNHNSASEKAYRKETIRQHVENGGSADEVTFIYKNVPTTGGKTGELTYSYGTVTGASSQSVKESWSLTNQRAGLSHGVTGKFGVKRSDNNLADEGGLNTSGKDSKTQAGDDENEVQVDDTGKTNIDDHKTSQETEKGGGGEHKEEKEDPPKPITLKAKFQHSDDWIKGADRDEANRQLGVLADYIKNTDPSQVFYIDIHTNLNKGDKVGGNTQYTTKYVSDLLWGRFVTVRAIIRKKSGNPNAEIRYVPHFGSDKARFTIRPKTN